jgi:hypothetical protein
MSGSGQDQQVGETATQREQSTISAQMFQHYMTNYKPVVDKYIAKETDPAVKTGRERQMAGQINADVMRKIDPSKMTANPVANTKMLANLADVKASAEVSGQGASKSREIMSEQNIIDIGRGKATSAQAGISELAGLSVSDAVKTKELEQQVTGSEENTIGSIAGMVAAGALKTGMGSSKKQITWGD